MPPKVTDLAKPPDEVTGLIPERDVHVALTEKELAILFECFMSTNQKSIRSIRCKGLFESVDATDLHILEAKLRWVMGKVNERITISKEKEG